MGTVPPRVCGGVFACFSALLRGILWAEVMMMTLLVYGTQTEGLTTARVSRVQNAADPEAAARAFEAIGWRRAAMPGWLADLLRAGVVRWQARYYRFSPTVTLTRTVGDEVLWAVLGVAAPGPKTRGALQPGTWVDGRFLPQPGGWDIRI